jgi:ribose 1,5-bisphosphokinase PhnN
MQITTKQKQNLEQLVSKTQSLEIKNPRLWDQLSTISSIVIIGSTCTGKSTMVNVLRESQLANDKKIIIPRRYVTREARPDDDPRENIYLTNQELEDLQSRDEIGINWKKPTKNGEFEYRAFEKVTSKALPVYFGNIEIFHNKDSIKPTGALDNALYIAVYAPDSVRQERLLQRSPELVAEKPDEVARRLKENVDSILPFVQLQINNYGQAQQFAKQELLKFVETLIAC